MDLESFTAKEKTLYQFETWLLIGYMSIIQSGSSKQSQQAILMVLQALNFPILNSH